MNYLVLHIIVFIWGFTGILGKYISLEAEALVWYRMWMAAGALILFNLFTKQPMLIIQKQWKTLLLASVFVAIHWVLFYGSIKVSTVSIGVVCMSTQAFMMSILQPLIKKTAFKLHEALLGIIVVVAIVIIFGFEYQYKMGILLGLLSSFFAVLFTILNARLIKELPATVIAGWEMSLGATLLSVYILVSGHFTLADLTMRGDDIYYLLILSLVCTALAFAVSVEIMKKLSPYTVSLSVNLEPVYTILLALFFFPETEKMSSGFYLGTGILLITVLAEPLILKINKSI